MAEVLFRAKLLREGASTPWGFRLQGGVEYSKPLTILKVTDISIAAKSGLHAGDIVVKLAGQSADDMTHKKAQQAILNAGNILEIIVERADVTIASSCESCKAEGVNDESDGAKKKTKNGPKDTTDLTAKSHKHTERADKSHSNADGRSDQLPSNLDSNANRISQTNSPNDSQSKQSHLRETKPPLDTVISSPDSKRKVLRFAKKKSDSYEGCTDSSSDAILDFTGPQNAQHTSQSVICESDSNAVSEAPSRSKGLSYLGWSSTSSDSDDSVSVKYPARTGSKPTQLLNVHNDTSDSAVVKDSKYPWRRERDKSRTPKLHVRSVSEPARSTLPSDMIGSSSLPKKSISVANLSSSDTRSSKSIKSSLESVSEETHEAQKCDSKAVPKERATNKSKLVKQEAIIKEDVETKDCITMDENERKRSNAEYIAPTANDIYLAAKDKEDVVGISLPQVKNMVSDLNKRLEKIAVNHPKLVQAMNTPELGISYSTSDKQVIQDDSVTDDSSSSDEKELNVQKLPCVERERSLDAHHIQKQTLSPNVSNNSANKPPSRTNSPSTNRKVHFADPPESKVIEIEPSERRKRKLLAAASAGGERRREDKYPEFFKTQGSEQEEVICEAKPVTDKVPIGSESIDERQSDSENRSPASSEVIDKRQLQNSELPISESIDERKLQLQSQIQTSTSESDSQETSSLPEDMTTERRQSIPEIAYASSSVKELAERLDRIERENELFRKSNESSSEKPLIATDITGRTYAVTANPATPATSVETDVPDSDIKETIVKRKEVSLPQNTRPISQTQAPLNSQAVSTSSITVNSSLDQLKVSNVLNHRPRRTSLQPTMERSPVLQYRKPPIQNVVNRQQTVPTLSIDHSYSSSSPSVHLPPKNTPIATISHLTTVPTPHVQASPVTTYTHVPYVKEPEVQPQQRYPNEHLSPMPSYQRISPQSSPARSPARSPNRSPIPPPQPGYSPVSQAELEYYKHRLLPQESPPPYNAARYNEMYRRFPRRNSTGGLMLSTSNMGPGRGFSFSIGGHGGPINVSFTQQRGGDPATQVAFQIPREPPAPGQPNQITYSLNPDGSNTGDSVSFNYTAPQYQSQPLLNHHHPQGGSYDESKVIQISYPPSPTVPMQRGISPNSIPSPEYLGHKDYNPRPEYFMRPVRPEPTYPEYYPLPSHHQVDSGISRGSPRTYLSPPVQQTKPPPPYPYPVAPSASEDTSALSQSKSFKNLENKFLLGGNISSECTQPERLTHSDNSLTLSDSSRKSCGVPVQAERAQGTVPGMCSQSFIPNFLAVCGNEDGFLEVCTSEEHSPTVPQPAASARPYIPGVPETTPTQELDLETVEKQAIERFMREQLNRTGEVFSSERTPPGLFAFFDKSFSEKLMERQYRRQENYAQSETLRLVKEMDLQQRYQGNQKQ